MLILHSQRVSVCIFVQTPITQITYHPLFGSVTESIVKEYSHNLTHFHSCRICFHNTELLKGLNIFWIEMKYFSKQIACVCMLLKNFTNKLGINNHIIMQNEPWTGQNNTLTSRKTKFSLCRVCCWLYICWIIQLYSLGDIGSTAVLLWDLVANMHIITCFLRFYK